MKNRIDYIDTLKALAIAGVIAIHISAGLLPYVEIPSQNWYFYVFWASIVRWSVPVFFMCSGVLFLNPDKNISLKQLFSKYLLRIVTALLFWALMYELFDVFRVYLSTGVVEAGSVKNIIKNILTCNTHFHFYYLYIIILIYLLVPIIKVFTNNSGRQILEYSLAVWLAVGIVFPFIIKFYPFTLLKGIVLQYALRMAYASIGYFVLGHYLQKYTVSKQLTNVIYILGIIGFASTFIGTAILSKKNINTLFLEGMSPNVAVMACALFLVVKNLNEKGYKWVVAIRPVIAYISKASFCIYLVHDFFNIIFRVIHFDTLINNLLASVPVLMIVNLTLSIGVYCVLSKIPYVKKYLI